MIPGQLRPTFATYDRQKRLAFTIAAALLGVVVLTNITNERNALPVLGIMVALLIASQIIYAVRIRTVRQVCSNLQHRFPEDRFLVGNVRFVGPQDRGPEGVRFTTTILQFNAEALSFWNPDNPSHAFAATPLAGLDIDVATTTPPRWSLVAPFSNDATYVALYGEHGLAFERPDRLRRLATGLFPTADFPEPLEPPRPRIGF